MGARACFGIASAVGKRDQQEDASFFYGTGQAWAAGLFDGHGGVQGSQEAARLIQQSMQSKPPRKELSPEYFMELFRATDEELSGKTGGTTALVVHRNDNALICAHAGDSRCLIISGKGVTTLTNDHRCANANERERVQRAGARLFKRESCYFVASLFGSKGIMMTRALNDPEWRGVGVIPDPDVVEYTLTPGAAFCCLLCDGVWEYVTPEAIAAIGWRGMSAQELADALVQTALKNGSDDNCTAVVIEL